MKLLTARSKGIFLLIIKIMLLSCAALVLLSGLARAARHNKQADKVMERGHK